jgi:predicted transposase YbfD/YdcC
MLAMAAAAVLAGARSLTAIAEWAADAPQPVRAALGARRDGPTTGRSRPRPPSAGPWPAWTPTPWPAPSARGWPTGTGTLAPPPGGDVRSQWTARPCAAPGAHQTAARPTFSPRWTTPPALAQQQVGGAPGEVPAFVPLLERLDLAGVVVTADALHTHPDAAAFLVTQKQAHYLFVVKANQPTLLHRCVALPCHRVPALDRTHDRGHGRVELRTLKAITVSHVGFPHAAQTLQVTRKVRKLHTRRWRTVTVYAITSLTFAQASPARLADLLRGHWAIEQRPALRPGRDLHPGRLPGPRRDRPAGHGLPAQPRHRHARPRGAGQSRRPPSATTPGTHAPPHHPRHHSRMNRTLRENPGALGEKPRSGRGQSQPQ